MRIIVGAFLSQALNASRSATRQGHQIVRYGASGGAIVGDEQSCQTVLVRQLVVGRGRHRLAGPFEFPLAAATITGVLGPSGVGKTTLGDTLLGLLPPLAGRVSWLGRALDRKTSRALRPRFQKLHQDPTSVFPSGRAIGDSLNDLRLLSGGAELVRGIPPLLDRLQVPARLLDRPQQAQCRRLYRRVEPGRRLVCHQQYLGASPTPAPGLGAAPPRRSPGLGDAAPTRSPSDPPRRVGCKTCPRERGSGLAKDLRHTPLLTKRAIL